MLFLSLCCLLHGQQGGEPVAAFVRQGFVAVVVQLGWFNYLFGA